MQADGEFNVEGMHARNATWTSAVGCRCSGERGLSWYMEHFGERSEELGFYFSQAPEHYMRRKVASRCCEVKTQIGAEGQRSQW
jgi:hypothetical protein